MILPISTVPKKHVLAAIYFVLLFSPTFSSYAQPAITNTRLAGAEQLSTEQIQQAFSDVRDDALVQDAAGTTAVNIWYADGSFVNNWSNAEASGRVTGRWRALHDQRCIVIESGLPEREGKEFCGAIYKQGEVYLSVNTDGSVHGRHRTTPLQGSH